MSENVTVAETVAGEVVDAPQAQDIVAHSADALSASATVLSQAALKAAAEGDDAAQTAYRARAASLAYALQSSQTVTVAYMVRLEDMIESGKRGKPATASYDKILDHYRDIMADAEGTILKSRLSQLRNVARIVIDCQFPIGADDAAWFVSKATTGQMTAKAIQDAAALALKDGPEAGIKALRDAREREAQAKLEAASKAEAEAEAARQAQAEAGSGAPNTRDSVSQSGTDATAQDTGKAETRAAQVPDGHSEDTPLSRAIDAIVKMPQDTAAAVADLMRVARELRVILESPAVKAMHAEAAKILADADAAEGKGKATPATVRRTRKAQG